MMYRLVAFRARARLGLYIVLILVVFAQLQSCCASGGGIWSHA